MTSWLLVMLGFWAGAIPFGVLVARGLGVDIRAHGSGNIGATNVTRVMGTVPGAFVLVLDAAKGALPTWLAWHHATDPWIVIATAAAAILGHCFSPFLAFRGGKGVATALGVFLVLAPELVLWSIVVFAIALKLTRVPALGSLAAIATLASLCLLRGEPYTAALALGTFVLLVYTHRTNLAKLRQR
ncbi:MAG TPA: glycerol-3-phosphate 1-O-acyltransferase PlsY [Kofleriaceae bacterium]|nr:glycerol-3-phosphate 1-O-acyltransferase PlsY [Kofleriaceae bacterium]